jgi:hypothetical protein
MHHYKLIILIIMSNNNDNTDKKTNECYAKMKQLTQLYLDLYKEHIKYYFIEYKDTLTTEVYENNVDLWFKGTESIIPGIYNKTIQAIEYINKTHNYDFIMRTNISSFLHIDNILLHLNKVEKTNYAGGPGVDNFISGTGIFMSRDVGNILVENQSIEQMHDDVLISKILHSNGILLKTMRNKWHQFISNNFNEHINFSNETLIFRIKNIANREIDVLYFKLLLNKIYNVREP